MNTSKTIYSIFPATKETLEALLNRAHPFYPANDEVQGSDFAIRVVGPKTPEMERLAADVSETLKRRGAVEVRIYFQG